MNNDLTTGQVAKILGVSKVTINKWADNKKLVPAYETEHGYKMYTKEQIEEFKNKLNNSGNPQSESDKSTETTEPIQPEQEQTQQNLYTLKAVFYPKNQNNQANKTITRTPRFKNTEKEDTLKRAGTLINEPSLLYKLNNGLISEWNIINLLCNMIDNRGIPSYLISTMESVGINTEKLNNDKELAITELCHKCLQYEDNITRLYNIYRTLVLDIEKDMPGTTGIKNDKEINFECVLQNLRATIYKQAVCLKRANDYIKELKRVNNLHNSDHT